MGLALWFNKNGNLDHTGAGGAGTGVPGDRGGVVVRAVGCTHSRVASVLVGRLRPRSRGRVPVCPVLAEVGTGHSRPVRQGADWEGPRVPGAPPYRHYRALVAERQDAGVLQVVALERGQALPCPVVCHDGLERGMADPGSCRVVEQQLVVSRLEAPGREPVGEVAQAAWSGISSTPGAGSGHPDRANPRIFRADHARPERPVRPVTRLCLHDRGQLALLSLDPPVI